MKSLSKWQNILPLITDSLDYGKSLVVGDGKQSIYRWRGGDINQFVNLYNNNPKYLIPISRILLENRKISPLAESTFMGHCECKRGREYFTHVRLLV